MYQDLFSLAGKTVMITGGSGYLGSAIAQATADFGARVVVLDVREANGAREADGRIAFVSCDVSATASISESFRKVRQMCGSIDVLINGVTYGAGYGAEGTVDRMSDEDWWKGLDGALGTTFRCTREAVPYMEEAGGGSIVNIASMYGVVSPDPSIYGDSGANNPANYGAGKAGVLQFTRYCAAHLAKKGIRVNSITPGPFPNDRVQQNEPFVEQLCRKTMLGRIGQPHDIVGAAMLLASDASAFMTGANLVVDGGWTAW
jgi:gluconate 5-dehydrogenase